MNKAKRIKPGYISFIVFLILLNLGCSGSFSDSSNDKTNEMNPKQLADLTIKLSNSLENEKDLAKLFNQYKHNLSSGCEMYNNVFETIKSDPEQYVIFKKELKSLLSRDMGLKELDKTDTNKKNDET